MSFKLLTIMGLAFMINIVSQFNSNRQLIIFGSQNDRLVQQQLQLLDSAADGLKDRDIKTIVVKNDSELFEKYQVSRSHFTVILIGKDGGEKHRTSKLLQTEQLFAIIDAMPMRKSEMKRNNPD